MTSPVHEVRALLTSFVQSPWRDVHFRSGGWSVFMAKATGGPNPMLFRPPQGVAAVTSSPSKLTAPHLGIFTARVATGAVVALGSVVGQVDKLGETTDIISNVAGRIAAILPGDGDLVEYCEPLVQVETA